MYTIKQNTKKLEFGNFVWDSANIIRLISMPQQKFLFWTDLVFNPQKTADTWNIP